MIRTKGKHKYFLYLIRNQKKFLRNRQRRNKKRNYGRRNCINRENNFLGNDYINVIRLLNEKNFISPWYISKHQETIRIPESFSISENPETVIKLLKRVYTISKCKNTKKLIFDYSHCINLGLSASTIMDIIVLATDKYREKQGDYLELMGRLPQYKPVKDILLASGLPYHIKAESFSHFDEEHVERFETVKGRHFLWGNKADETATKLMLYFNRCLKTQSMELNDEGKRLLSRILGEVISNCEIHGGDAATWYTQGHYQIKDDNSFGEMQMLFLNLGDTIYEGLKNDSSDETECKLKHILKSHKKYQNANWDEEMIYTIFALQEGISRLRDKNIRGYEGRGSGTVSLIEMFNAIGKSESGLIPQMTIISGKTQIRFTDKYKMRYVKFDNDVVFGTGEKKIIAFNKENDIYLPPDRDNVIKMSEYFPGTVISLKFYLDNRYIINRKGNR